MRRNASFGFLWAGQSLALFGDVFYTVALIMLLFHETGSATSTALVGVVRVGAQMIGGLLAPLLLDRFRLQRLLVSAMFGQTVYFVLLTLFCLFFLTRSNLLLVFVFLFAGSLIEAWTAPARNALLPRLVSGEQLVKANGYLATTDQSVQFVGWAAGGTVVALIGAERTLWLTFALYVLSLLCMSLVRDDTEQTKEQQQEQVAKWESLRAGWVTIGRDPALRTILLMEAVEGIANGAWMGAVVLLFCKDVLHRGEAWWGLINASFTAGTIGGGLVVLALAHRLDRRLGLAILVATFFYGALTLAFTYTALPWLALLICLLMGPPGQIKDIAKRTMFQQHVDHEQLPKVFSAHGTVVTATFTISAFVMAPVADRFGAQTAFLLSTVLYGVSMLIAAWNRTALLQRPD